MPGIDLLREGDIVGFDVKAVFTVSS